MLFEFARFLPMCELVIISHELKLLMMGTLFFIEKYDFYLDREFFMEKMAQNCHILKKDFFQIFMISLSRWSRI
jgi:hypothetical protein